MLANILRLHTTLTHRVGSIIFSFLVVVMVQIKLTGMTHRLLYKQISCFCTHPRPLDGSKGKTIFSERGHIAYQITKKELKNIMQVKRLTHGLGKNV